MTASGVFQVEEIFTGQDELLVLSLGFVSDGDPLDIVHIVCGHTRSGCMPATVSDLLYIERSDQSLACDGRDVIGVAGYADRLELFLTDQGAEALDLPEQATFRFDQHPELTDEANHILDAMILAGQASIAVHRSPGAGDGRDRWPSPDV